ncbi:MAG: hypothetical protein ACU836_02650 [Gammaproteobacteria bacterium]
MMASGMFAPNAVMLTDVPVGKIAVGIPLRILDVNNIKPIKPLIYDTLKNKVVSGVYFAYLNRVS